MDWGVIEWELLGVLVAIISGVVSVVVAIVRGFVSVIRRLDARDAEFASMKKWQILHNEECQVRASKIDDKFKHVDDRFDEGSAKFRDLEVSLTANSSKIDGLKEGQNDLKGDVREIKSILMGIGASGQTSGERPRSRRPGYQNEQDRLHGECARPSCQFTLG